MPQHQRRDCVAAGQFDLRTGLARVQAEDQRAQRHQHGVDVGRQHRAFADVRHVAALALVKAYQHLAFLCT
jgi:hypothetical protein